ncbi:uncharacterized protein TNCV_2703841 [Trichonephila clavipes]|nr:uncharacterized protein TNCV_2703841 [Trichonephila clavipes]
MLHSLVTIALELSETDGRHNVELWSGIGDDTFTCRNCGGGDRGRVAIYRPFGEVSLSLNRTVTCMMLKTNDRRTSCPCHDEFRGPCSDYVRQKRTVTLNTFTTTLEEKKQFPTRRLKVKINVDEISSSRDSTGLAIETSSHTSMELGSRVDDMSCDSAELGREQIKYMRSFQIHRFSVRVCSLFTALSISMFQVLAVSHSCSSIYLDNFVLLVFLQ